MTECYRQFSEVLDHLANDEEAWLRRQLEYVCVFGDREYGEHDLPAGLDPEDADWEGIRAWRGREEVESPWDVGFDYEFGNDEEGDWGRYLWFHSGESDAVDAVACLVQQFLGRFRPDRCWSLTWAFTCSKPAVGLFGGGAVFVTAEKIEWLVAWDFVEDRRKRFDEERT